VRAVADEIAAVQRKIEDVDGQIKQLSDEITGVRKEKGQGWQDELGFLQQEKQQLVEEKRQLREKERLLQEEKLLLMKREE
jgi:chromosome segregation ATPase